ncbi:hypothetical protein [Endozoicomonas numazuensis]|nr:hypothetical protein [Endozoicomonas numazuensis]
MISQENTPSVSSMLRYTEEGNISANEKLLFNGLSVSKTKDLSCTYFPVTKAESKINAIGFSTVPLEKRIVITFYYNPRDKHFSFYHADPKIRDLYDHVIWHQDTDHKIKFHKRLNPLDEHVHYSCNISDLENGTFKKLLIKAINLSNLEPYHHDQFVKGVSHLVKQPNEPGFSYIDGSLLQNGGSKDFLDKEAKDEQYIEGPYMEI